MGDQFFFTHAVWDCLFDNTATHFCTKFVANTKCLFSMRIELHSPVLSNHHISLIWKSRESSAAGIFFSSAHWACVAPELTRLTGLEHLFAGHLSCLRNNPSCHYFSLGEPQTFIKTLPACHRRLTQTSAINLGRLWSIKMGKEIRKVLHRVMEGTWHKCLDKGMWRDCVSFGGWGGQFGFCFVTFYIYIACAFHNLIVHHWIMDPDYLTLWHQLTFLVSNEYQVEIKIHLTQTLT